MPEATVQDQVLPPITGQLPVGPCKNSRKWAKQLRRMQDRLFLDSESPKTEVKDRAAVVRAWDVLEERKRIWAGKPLPGQLRPAETAPKSKKRPAGQAFKAPIVAPIVPANGGGSESEQVKTECPASNNSQGEQPITTQANVA